MNKKIAIGSAIATLAVAVVGYIAINNGPSKPVMSDSCLVPIFIDNPTSTEIHCDIITVHSSTDDAQIEGWVCNGAFQKEEQQDCLSKMAKDERSLILRQRI